MSCAIDCSCHKWHVCTKCDDRGVETTVKNCTGGIECPYCGAGRKGNENTGLYFRYFMNHTLDENGKLVEIKKKED